MMGTTPTTSDISRGRKLSNVSRKLDAIAYVISPLLRESLLWMNMIVRPGRWAAQHFLSASAASQTPNAGHQARRAAGAERTLAAVACMPSLDVPHA
jgi:hypothetical protein